MFKPFLTIPLVAAAPAFAAPPEVAVDIPVTGALVSAVALDGPAPTVLTDAEQDPRTATLVPDSATALEEAELAVVMDADLAPWLDRVSERLDLSLLELAGIPGTELFSDMVESGVASYPWLAPRNVPGWLDAIAERMAEFDGMNAETYRTNAASAADAVETALEDVTAALLSQPARPILATTPAWAPVTEAFDIEIVGYTGTTGMDPLAAMPELSFDDVMAEEDPACILASPTDDLEAARRVADAARIPIVEVDPFGGTADGIEGYTSILSDLADAMESCVTL